MNGAEYLEYMSENRTLWVDLQQCLPWRQFPRAWCPIPDPWLEFFPLILVAVAATAYLYVDHRRRRGRSEADQQ